MSRLARALGTFYFLRGRGTWFVELVRGWLAPAGVAGGLTKYLGAETSWSLAVAVAIPFVVEGVGGGGGGGVGRRQGRRLGRRTSLADEAVVSLPQGGEAMNCLACGTEMATVGPKCVAELTLDDPEGLTRMRVLADALQTVSEGLRAATDALDRILNARAPVAPAAPPDRG